MLIDHRTPIADVLVHLLRRRSVRKSGEFLHPPHPLEYSTAYAVQARELLKLAKDAKSILIYGDYDTDGLTSSAILYLSLVSQGITPQVYIPHRQRDGYGFKFKSDFKSDLIITVDNGIVAHTEIAKAQKKGIKVVVIDHHQSDDTPSTADLVIHNPDTSASGLTWLVCRQFDDHSDLGLASLGVVADCVPLLGINRSLVVHGLQSLTHRPSLGVLELIRSAGLTRRPLTAYDLAFVLSPRLNAAGRLSDPQTAFELLSGSDPATLASISAQLAGLNLDRQEIQQQLLHQIEKQVDPDSKLLFASSDQASAGIIGLIAGRLTEKFHLPSVIIAIENGTARGSCRSIDELDIIDTLRQFSSLFLDLGGHPLAAGFTISTTKIPSLQKKLTSLVDKKLSDYQPQSKATFEAEMTLSAVKPRLIKALSLLEPFGVGNPQPLFLFHQVRLASLRQIGQSQQHLKLRLDDPSTPARENTPAEAVAFKKGDLFPQLQVGQLVDIVASLDLNIWNGTTSPQLVVRDIITHG